MAMRKIGKAVVAEVLTGDYRPGWDRVRKAAKATALGGTVLARINEILGEEFDPKRYLLSHATIVCSVETEVPPGAKTGAVEVDGKRVNRKTAAYRVKAECDKYINNNHDCWSRAVLLKSYPTFIGENSFLEHVQKPELSKGKVLDAVARDLGDTVYIDLLIANDWKHKELCDRIVSGEMNTLSMGCVIDGSTCTKCGNWAADETEMCDHILYEKGNYFHDERGVRRRIAELCGDESISPTGGNRFNDASWVETPAFEGARARGVLDVLPGVVSRPSKEAMVAAARAAVASEGGSVRTAAEGGGEVSLLQEIKKDFLEYLKADLRREIQKLNEPAPRPTPDPTAPNDSVIKQGEELPQQIQRFARASKTRRELMGRTARYLSAKGVRLPSTFYRAILRFAADSKTFSSVRELHAFVGRQLTPTERRLFKLAVRLARQIPTER